MGSEQAAELLAGHGGAEPEGGRGQVRRPRRHTGAEEDGIGVVSCGQEMELPSVRWKRSSRRRGSMEMEGGRSRLERRAGSEGERRTEGGGWGGSVAAVMEEEDAAREGMREGIEWWSVVCV